MTFAAGTKIGPYEVLAPVGFGGMGEVYRAHDPQLGRDVAIKVLPSFLSRDPDRLRRFEQEARAAAALNHPNILAVYQMGTYEGAPYLVSELLEGSTLRDQLLRGPLPVRKAVDYAIQIAQGLAAAHEKGIVHRDLKPENLFLTKDGRIKILDFGLAKLIHGPEAYESSSPTLTEGTEPGVTLGTVGYMSPEQVRGSAADNRADLFAFGAILYEMLTGRRAFHKPTSAETMSAILNEDPSAISQLTSGISPALPKVAQRCLEKNPEQRFHSASDLAFALEALSDTGSGPSGAFAVAKSRTSSVWVIAAGLIIAIAMVFGIWFTRAPAVPIVESVVQLTNDGILKAGGLETDGSRIYFNEGPSGSFSIAQVSVHGGQTGAVTTNLVNPQIAGLTADGSSLLVLTGAPLPSHVTMWSLPLPVGEPRRLGDADGIGASLFPDGRILYALNSTGYIAERDGSNPRKLEEATKYTTEHGLLLDAMPNVSTDGKQVALSAFDNSTHSKVILQAASDGTGNHPILTGGQRSLPTNICCPTWTPDGKYLLFRAETERRWDIWAFFIEKRLLEKSLPPVRLTNGPVSYSSFAASPDGKQIFAVGAQRRGELVRYDSRTREFVAFLGGISAYDPTFSRDGKWVAYLSYPEHTLWRSRADGSDRLQLTYPPMVVIIPRISPDGSKVAFSTWGGPSYLVGMEGGTPKKVTDALTSSWSPDGGLLALDSYDPSTGAHHPLGILDVRTGNISTVPDSQDMNGPWFAGQDTLIATTNDSTKLVVFDIKTRKRSDLIANPNGFLNWIVSPDGKYFFYQTGGNDPKIFRMRMADRTVEEMASLKGFRAVDDPYQGNTQLNVAPDNSALLTRDIGTEEVYAISVKWP